MEPLVRISRRLCQQVDRLSFGPPVTHVYNPLKYARKPYELYLTRFGGGRKSVVFIGMNPGPFGMAQTGVPFGDVSFARDWMGIEAPVGTPPNEHPKRPVQGFACPRSEVSGSRVWGWARDRFGDAERFFERFLVLNYCPLVFLEESGRNRTPDKLPRAERDPLTAACNAAFRAAIEHLKPERVVGIGKWANQRATQALVDMGIPVGMVLHPSPASPKANRGWAKQAEAELRAFGVEL